MAKKPYQDTPLAQFIERRMLELKPRKTQTEIAVEAGFVNVNVASMLKSGSTKLPLDRVPGLAKALEVDPKLLFRLALLQVGQEMTMHAIEEIFGTIVTRNEVAWLEAIREASNNTDPALTTRARSTVFGIFGK